MSERQFDLLQQVAGSVSRETFHLLKDFETDFLRWSARINLAAESTLGDIWERHILDSAQLALIAPPAAAWLDLGSGGGFPGAVVAIVLEERCSMRMDLVESSRKKAAFLQTSLGKLRIPIHVHACRIEQISVPQPDIVTARALAPLSRLIEMASPWLTRGARGFFHKGRGYRTEVEESRNIWGFDLVEHPNRVSPDGMILEITRLHRL